MQTNGLAPHEQLLSISIGYWQANAVGLATQLGLADFLAEGPLTVEELAKRAEVNAPALFRLLRALESIGIFTQTAPGVFANSPVSQLLRKDVPGSQEAMIRHLLVKGNGCYEAWNDFDYTIQSGNSSVEKIYGCKYWDFLRANPQASEATNGAMRSVSISMTPAVTEAYDWARFPQIVDVGGGIGTQIVSILDASPRSKGIVFDQPHVVTDSLQHNRLKAVAGNFFDSVPSNADAYLLRFVLHDWSDEEAAAILRSVRNSMKPSATLILAELMIPEGPEPTINKWTDLHMMVMCQSAQERTQVELQKLLAKERFELVETVATTSPITLLIAKPQVAIPQAA
jgi:hypothetical protein